MTKILEIFGEPVSNGGQEAFLFNVLQNMDLTNLKIDVLTPYYCDNEFYKQLIEELKGEMICLNLLFEPGRSRNNIYKPIKEYLKHNHYDVVHIHSGSISVLALVSLAAKKEQVNKIIVHSHATGNRKNPKYRITKFLMTPILDRCPTDYCACSIMAGEWKFSNRAMKKLFVLKNGVDLNKFRYSSEIREIMRDRLGISKNDYVIGHVGRFSYEKNQQFIIGLLKAVKSSIPEAKALLVGSGDTMDAVRKLSEESGLTESVLFTGKTNDVQDYLQAMDVFVLPSLFEGLGIAGIEAQANGLSVIASENIPSEMAATSLVHFINLENMQDWNKAILEAQSRQRECVQNELKKQGFDIHDTAKQIEKMYNFK